MKNCPRCGAQLNDEAVFCTNCGASIGGQGGPQPQNQYYNNQYQQPVMVMPYDHTADFEAKDIADHKLICMLAYLMGVVGLIIGMLARDKSPYVTFHVRQAMKIQVIEILLGFCAMVLAITIIVPIAAVIALGILFVIRIICFVQVCCNKASEPVIIRSLPFLN